MEIWHLRLSSDGRHPLFPSEQERRAAVRVIVARAGLWLVVFGIVDDHVHLILVSDRKRAAKVARAVKLGLRSISVMPFEPPYLELVKTRPHLLRLAAYVIEQPRKHGLDVHPALWSGSCFADIVGARHIEGLGLRWPDVLLR